MRSSFTIAMTDLEKATYLGEHIGQHVHFYHRLNGDSTAKIISLSAIKRTFEYSIGDSTQTFTMSFGEVVEFGFRNNGIPPAIMKVNGNGCQS